MSADVMVGSPSATRARIAGIAFLQKPVTRQSLARKVREVLDARPERQASR